MFRSVDNGLRAMDVRSLTEAAQSSGSGLGDDPAPGDLPQPPGGASLGCAPDFRHRHRGADHRPVPGPTDVRALSWPTSPGARCTSRRRWRLWPLRITWVAMGMIAFITRPQEATMSGGSLSARGGAQGVRWGRRRRGLQPRRGARRVRQFPRAVGMRENDDSANGGRASNHPASGTIRLAGEDVTYAKPNERNIGMVFQSYALFPNMTVSDNIGFGLRVRKQDKARPQGKGGRATRPDPASRQGQVLPV